MANLKEITENRYYELLEVVPPIYIAELDGKKIFSGFAVGEANRHANDGRPAYTVCYMADNKCLQVEAVLSSPNGKPIMHTEGATYSTGNKAQSIQ